MTGDTMREERKVVTALFADVVGSTEITERLDPEDARELLGDAVGRMVEAVERFGGTVKDLAGDGVLALFGAPVAHEDDAERAVRAALRILEDVRGRDDAGPSPPSGLSVRVGIESGLVVLGPVGAGARIEYGATGDAINTAARLQSHAAPGAILVGGVTQRAVREVFEWGDERRLELKGKLEAVLAFEVFDVRDRAARRGKGRSATPIIGRAEELSRASEVAHRALVGQGGVVLVVGEPGIGKSRLVDELRRDVERSFATRWLQGQCVSFGRSTPYLPLRELVLDALEIPHDEHNLAAALRKRLPAVAPDAIDEVAPFLEAVLGIAGQERTRQLSPETLQLRALEALRFLFGRLADAGPVVISIEDLHWSDPSSLHAIERLVPTALDAPVLYVLTLRDREGPTERLLKLSTALPPERRDVIELTALPAGADAGLVDALLGGAALSPDLRRRVMETAGGNPFFIGELVRSLMDSGIIGRDGETPAGQTGLPVELPTTVEKVILARLDVLDSGPRDVLTAASVLGRDVSVPLLERVTQSDPQPAVEELLRLDLLRDEGRPDELLFTHALIQEVAYGMLLKKRRRELHGRAAAAIGELWPDRVEENLAVLAHHHRGAGDAEAARRCHVLAAERAELLHAGEEALQHLTSAIELAEELGDTVADREVAELFLARARVQARTGDVQGAKDDLQTVLDGTGADGVPGLAMRAHDELGFVLAGAADYRKAVPHLQAALDAAVELEDRAAQVSALSRLALVHTNRLDFDAGLEYGRRAMTLAESLRDERVVATAMDGLKQVALQTGDFETLDRLAGRLAEIHRRNDDLWLLQFVVLEVGYADVARARLDSAFARLEESLAINRRIGDRGNEPLLLGALGWAHRARGDYGPALAVGREAFALARELAHEEWIAWSAAELAASLLDVGALGEAGRVLEEGADAADRSAADVHLVRCLALNAWATYQLGDRERGVELADRATSIFARIRVRPPRAFVPGRDAYAAVARVRIGQGLLEDATSLLEPVVAACEACGWSDGIVDGWLALGDVALRRADVPAATAAAERALIEALRSGLPTQWRVHAALADAYRAGGAEERAADYARRAENLVADLLGGIDDAAIRDAFSANAAEQLSGEKGEG